MVWTPEWNAVRSWDGGWDDIIRTFTQALKLQEDSDWGDKELFVLCHLEMEQNHPTNTPCLRNCKFIWTETKHSQLDCTRDYITRYETTQLHFSDCDLFNTMWVVLSSNCELIHERMSTMSQQLLKYREEVNRNCKWQMTSHLDHPGCIRYSHSLQTPFHYFKLTCLLAPKLAGNNSS